MGVTINYEGRLKSNDVFDDVIKQSIVFADSNEMEYEVFEISDKLLQRVRNEEDWDYQGYVRGIKIQPQVNCEPLWIEFDIDNYIQDYCKTQYAGVETHIKIIKHLKTIEPYFSELIVDDEGEYWDSDDLELLEKHFQNNFDAIEKLKIDDPNLDGPYLVEGSRIIDLM